MPEFAFPSDHRSTAPSVLDTKSMQAPRRRGEDEAEGRGSEELQHDAEEPLFLAPPGRQPPASQPGGQPGGQQSDFRLLPALGALQRFARGHPFGGLVTYHFWQSSLLAVTFEGQHVRMSLWTKYSLNMRGLITSRPFVENMTTSHKMSQQ